MTDPTHTFFGNCPRCGGKGGGHTKSCPTFKAQFPEGPPPVLTAMPEGHQPMVMPITRSQLLWLINRYQRENGQSELPLSTEFNVFVPHGGDYSGQDLILDDDQLKINARFRR